MNKKILENVPEDSPLYSYLANKVETSDFLGSQNKAPLLKEPLLIDLTHYNQAAKVLLINPPICVPNGMPKRCLQPAAIAYIGGFLREAGINVELLDCIVEGWTNEELIDEKNGIYTYGMSDEAVADYLAESKPDIVGLSLIFSQDLRNLAKISKVTKEVLPNAIVVVGGLHPTMYPDSTFKNTMVNGERTIDYILRGEGEHRLAEFVSNYQQGKVDKNQDGLIGYFDGEMVKNPEIRKIQDLDSLPLPAYDLLPMDKYFEINMPCNCFPNGSRVMAVHTSRGCPIGCTFCSSTNFNYLFRTRSAESVYKEIKYYKETYGVDEVQFLDDNLLLSSSRAEEIFDAIKPLNITWCTPNGTMIITWKPHLMEKAIASGMYQVTLALDGLGEESFNLSRKPVNTETLPDKIDEFRKQGVLVHGFVVVGLPGETEENVTKGLEWVTTLNFTSCSIYIAQPYPGSELYEVELAKGNIKEEDGLLVVKTKSCIQNMEMDNVFLEETIRSFTKDYEKVIKAREGEGWNFRYESKLERLAQKDLHLIIGTGDRINMLIQAERLGSD